MRSESLNKASIIVWSSLILITGLHFRTRVADDALKTDFIIIIQIIISFIATILGFLQTDNYNKWGYGAKFVLTYIIIAFVSGVFSPYPKLVFGYSILLTGAGFLTISLIQQASNVNDFLKLEKAWLFMALLIIISNSIMVYFSGTPTNKDIDRLGEGITSPSMFSFLCAYALGVSFISIRSKCLSILFWLLRLLLIALIILTKTRMPLVLCFIILFLHLLFSTKRNKIYLGIVLFSTMFSTITITALLYSFDISFVKKLFYEFNRQDPSTLYTLTGRTAIWATTLKILLKNIYRCSVGYGYGISRLILNIEYSKISIAYAFHTHNYFLEHLFNMGILGLITSLLLVIYGAKWIVNYNKLSASYSNGFSSRAFTMMVLFYFSSITEIPLGGKINPIALVVIFYIVVLDKKLP